MSNKRIVVINDENGVIIDESGRDFSTEHVNDMEKETPPDGPTYRSVDEFIELLGPMTGLELENLTVATNIIIKRYAL